METATKRDLISAGILVVFGSLFAGYALVNLNLGSFAMMGPGLFPFVIGIVIAGLGALQTFATVSQHRRSRRSAEAGEPTVIEWRSLCVVVAAMGVFSAVIVNFGLIAAIFALTLVSSFASTYLNWRSALALSVVLSVAAYLIFVLALGLPFTLYRWPL